MLYGGFVSIQTGASLVSMYAYLQWQQGGCLSVGCLLLHNFWHLHLSQAVQLVLCWGRSKCDVPFWEPQAGGHQQPRLVSAKSWLAVAVPRKAPQTSLLLQLHNVCLS